ncbi:DUF1203 domain-containing protein [Jannaschia rubra]|uniref:DUF1203 domain-containing protein n=1 Tax=Jannaschia rubra TaxID=282197 RepID=A0A0M6XKT0_9RHOB|nr:DUF1203 domain-containing protein [Jannaschia rubra]CTQ31790.1 hypothetical protein JAN5088_00549 [Jannaschia rubra]SFG53840.1 Protein of unknown function [Jannaschia rubra]
MQFTPYDPDFVGAVRAGGSDAHGQPAERAVSDGIGVPCRSCLCDVPKGAEYLILAARPFPAPQPYAETGPIFLCADACTPWEGDGVPPILTTSPDYLIKAYTSDHRIRYGTGAVVAAGVLMAEVARRLSDPGVAFVDVRSARNNCFQTRARRDAEAGQVIG